MNILVYLPSLSYLLQDGLLECLFQSESTSNERSVGGEIHILGSSPSRGIYEEQSNRTKHRSSKKA